MGDEQPLKGGRLARQAAMLCQNKDFLFWLDGKRGMTKGTHTADSAREWMVGACKVQSRAHIDHDQYAAAMLRKITRAYMRDTGSEQ